jgi:HAE1 family hydrophobic/amphiphilic exporter-1
MDELHESLLTPFEIMFSLTVSLVGAFGGLYLTGNTFNIYSMIGMIMLMGLVGKNAISWTTPGSASRPSFSDWPDA